MNSFFYQSNYLRAGGMSVVSGRCFAQEARRHVPMLAIFGDDRNGLLIIAGEHSNQRLTAFRLKGDAVADLEVQHLRVRAHLVEKPQAFHDPVVQINQFFFA